MHIQEAGDCHGDLGRPYEADDNFNMMMIMMTMMMMMTKAMMMMMMRGKRRDLGSSGA